jgi:predicted DNA-binding transcriptional regulator AlpA
MVRKSKREKSLRSTSLHVRDSISTLRRQSSGPRVEDLIPGPKLRAKLGISAVTLWRWRHDEDGDFPAPKVIKGRLYFPLDAVTAWIAKQSETV